MASIIPTDTAAGSPGMEVVSRQSNLIVESKKTVSEQRLREMLMAEIKRQNKPYGLYFEQVTGGYTTHAAARPAGLHGDSADRLSRLSGRTSR